MASLSDNFNSISDGDYLDADSNWASNLTSGGRMQSDRHSDTDDGTQVIDGSSMMNQQYAIYQTALDGEDHEVSLDCFPDSTAGNSVGVLARCSSASDYSSPTCYRARFNTDTSGVLELHKVVSGVSTSLGTWTGYNNDTTTVYDLKLICDGSTISVEVDGTERISVTDTSITTGDYAGIYFHRQFANPDGQPWVDNFAAADLAGSGTQSLTLPTISSGATLHAPTIAPGSVTVTLPTISSGAQLYAPTIAPGSVTVTLPTISSGAQLYAPTIAPGSVTVTLPTISSGAQLYAPSLAQQQFLTLPLIDSSIVPHAPTEVAAGNVTLVLPTIPSGSTLHEMTVVPGAVSLSLPAIASTATLHAMSVSQSGATLELVLPHLDGTTLHVPTVTPGAVGLTLPLISSGSTAHAPSLTLAPYPISLPHIDSTATLHGMTVVPGAVAIALPAIDGSITLHVPIVGEIPAQTLVLPHLTETQLHAIERILPVVRYTRLSLHGRYPSGPADRSGTGRSRLNRLG